MRSIGCAALLALTLAGCTHAHATSSPPSPPLDVPAPPPRDVVPADAETPPPAPQPQEPARTAPARPRPTPPREQPPRAEAPKPEPAPPAETAKPDEPPKPPATPLQTMPPNAEGDAERAIRATLQRATGDLNRVDYRALNADARTQYDTAKRMVRQADDAVRAKNLVFAKNLADKAAALAAQLAGR